MHFICFASPPDRVCPPYKKVAGCEGGMGRGGVEGTMGGHADFRGGFSAFRSETSQHAVSWRLGHGQRLIAELQSRSESPHTFLYSLMYVNSQEKHVF